MSTQDIVTQIEAALEGTTPGPWTVHESAVYAPDKEHQVDAHHGKYGVLTGTALRRPDARLIAAAPTILREAAATITRLRDALAPFAEIPPTSYDNSPLVEVRGKYADGCGWLVRPRDAVERARAALLGSGAGEGER